MNTSDRAVTLFYSYSHRDSMYRDELSTHLALMRRRGMISEWHDRRIDAGQDWAEAIDNALWAADVILLLISADFIASDYCFGKEMAAALARQRSRAAEVVPVIVRSVDNWQEAPFGHLQALPTDGKPVASWPNRDEAWTIVASGIRKVVERIRVESVKDGVELAPRASERSVLLHNRDIDVAYNDESIIQQAIDRFVARTENASASRHIAPEPSTAKRSAEELADLRAPKRVLWVDDNPGNNVYEMSALFALQIDVVTATSTEEALDILRLEPDFDLIITDWRRDPQKRRDTPEGLRLLQELRAGGWTIPSIVYHGAFTRPIADIRNRQARQHGALGATADPQVLMEWSTRALSGITAESDAQ